jgi:hypothetical protein
MEARRCGEVRQDLEVVYNRAREASDVLHAQAAEIHELTKRLEALTKDTPPGTPPRGPK